MLLKESEGVRVSKTDGKMIKFFIEESQLIKVGGMRELEHSHFAVHDNHQDGHHF